MGAWLSWKKWRSCCWWNKWRIVLNTLKGFKDMDLIKEIWDKSLPNFGYVIDLDDGGQCVVVLGGQSIRKAENIRFREAICRRNEQMQEIYGQDVLSDEDKIELARLMKKMYSLCEARIEGLYTRGEQAAFISKLSEMEAAQLEAQVRMLKDCRQFWKEYLC